MGEVTARSRHARALFAGVAPTYDTFARLLSLGQDPRWRRFLVSRVAAGPGDTVLDVATGTAAVAIELVRQKGCDVVGVDQSPEMLAAAQNRLQQAGLHGRIRLVEASADALPFAPASFAGLTFTYLLRYVDDPGRTLGELARVVRPGGTVAMLEFGVPPRRPWRLLWRAYVGAGLPFLARVIGGGWRDVGSFLGPSIRGFYADKSPDDLAELWRSAGIVDVRMQHLSLGGGLVVWGTRSG